MPRKKVRSFRLYGRLSENNMTEEELNFVEEQLQNQTSSQFVRQAVKIYYKYAEGKMMAQLLRKLQDMGIKELPQTAEEDEKYKELDDIIDEVSLE